MRKPLIAAVAVPLAAAGALAVPALAATKSVSVGDNWFVRSSGSRTIYVHKGDAVRWTWRGQNAHDVFVKKGPERFHSAIRGHGYSFSHRFRHAGTYAIVCTIHAPNMAMKVVVR